MKVPKFCGENEFRLVVFLAACGSPWSGISQYGGWLFQRDGTSANVDIDNHGTNLLALGLINWTMEHDGAWILRTFIVAICSTTVSWVEPCDSNLHRWSVHLASVKTIFFRSHIFTPHRSTLACLGLRTFLHDFACTLHQQQMWSLFWTANLFGKTLYQCLAQVSLQ